MFFVKQDSYKRGPSSFNVQKINTNNDCVNLRIQLNLA